MTPMMTPKIDIVTAGSIDLEDRGRFGPPLGEPIDGPMSTAGIRLWESADGTVNTGLWSCSEGRFRTTFGASEGELIWVVSGTLTCAEDDGPTSRLEPGDAMLFPPLWSGEWRIEGTLRKLRAWWEGAGGPGRGSGSAISTPKLSPSEAVALVLEEGEPFSAKRAADGPLATRDRTLWRSSNGAIETGVWEIDAGQFQANFGAYGELIRVIGGEVAYSGDDGSRFTLRGGDWMTFPRGWTGEWDVLSPLRKIYVTWESR